MKGLIVRMIKTVVVLGIAEAIPAFFIDKTMAVGVAIGSFGAIVDTISLWYDINRAVERRKPPRGFYGRYAFNAVLMLAGGLISVGALIGVFIGLLNVKIAAYAMGWRDRG